MTYGMAKYMLYAEYISKRAGTFIAALAVLSACANGANVASPMDDTDLAAAQQPQPPAPVFVQSDLLGRSAQELDARLGQPVLVRAEGSGELRTYDFADCALLVLLKQGEGAVKQSALLYAGAKHADSQKPSLDSCLARGPTPS